VGRHLPAGGETVAGGRASGSDPPHEEKPMNKTQLRRERILHRTTKLLESIIEIALEPRSTEGIRRCVRRFGDDHDEYGIPMLDVREQLLVADAVDCGDRPALAAQVRRIADKVHELALQAAAEIEEATP